MILQTLRKITHQWLPHSTPVIVKLEDGTKKDIVDHQVIPHPDKQGYTLYLQLGEKEDT